MKTIDLATDPRCENLNETSSVMREMMRQLIDGEYDDIYQTKYAKRFTGPEWSPDAPYPNGEVSPLIKRRMFRIEKLVKSIVNDGLKVSWDNCITTHLDILSNNICLMDGMHRYNIGMVLFGRGVIPDVPAKAPPRQWLQCPKCNIALSVAEDRNGTTELRNGPQGGG